MYQNYKMRQTMAKGRLKNCNVSDGLLLFKSQDKLNISEQNGFWVRKTNKHKNPTLLRCQSALPYPFKRRQAG